MKIEDVIRRPLLTEKSTLQRDNQNVMVFEVDPRANKIEVAAAVEALFRVKVAEVRVARVHGKWRQQGRFMGRRRDWKKAYVRLAAGEKAPDLFAGV
jgi:large subunit ribosomal protein L23